MKVYYKHTNGTIFRILYEGKHAVTGEELLIYQAMFDKGEIWVLPKKKFLESSEFVKILESEALLQIPVELNPKYFFPEICYMLDVPNLIDDNSGFSKNVQAMKTLLIKKNLINENLFSCLKNDDDLEKLIIDRIKSYNSGEELEEIFHLIQIWGGSAGRGIYVFGNGFTWEDVGYYYQQLVDACFMAKDISEPSVDIIVKAVSEFNKAVRNLGVAFITKHTRYWLYRNLGLNAFPIYDSIMANCVMKKGTAEVRDLLEYWRVMIAKSTQLGVKLVPLERQIFKYAYQHSNRQNYKF